MSFEELGKTLNRSLFVSLDKIGGKPLVKGFYALGITAVALWAINHLFYTFSLGFGAGLWGLVEITVFGLFFITGLRILSEVFIVYLQAHSVDAEAASTNEVPATLVDEVREAIEELGIDLGDEEPDNDEKTPFKRPTHQPKKAAAAAKVAKRPAAAAAKKPAPRTARRTPQSPASPPKSQG